MRLPRPNGDEDPCWNRCIDTIQCSEKTGKLSEDGMTMVTWELDIETDG